MEINNFTIADFDIQIIRIGSGAIRIRRTVSFLMLHFIADLN